MSIGEFLKDKMIILIWNILLFTLFIIILRIGNIQWILIFFMFCIWFLPLVSYMACEFIKHKKYYNEINNILEKLDKKYLLPEMLKETSFIEGAKLNYILKDISRDMHENVKYYKDMQDEYREFIETWVHEIKTPIASTKLIIENNQNDITNKIDFQINKVEGFVEQVLYYARSNNVREDYIIKRISLDSIVRHVVKRNYRDFIQKRIKINIKNVEKTIYSDDKWIGFIINQIIGNSIKYSRSEDPVISIYSINKENAVILIIEDNGIGISDKDINRVFEKGFTGVNGRLFSKSTGMGLYLCKKLCFKLGLKISVESDINSGTKVSIIFPVGNTIDLAISN